VTTTARPPRRDLHDYYIAPNSDFTQYTRDYEEKYWSKDTAFDWGQSAGGPHLASLGGQLHRIALSRWPWWRDHRGPRQADISAGACSPTGTRCALGEVFRATATVSDRRSRPSPLEQLQLPAARLATASCILRRLVLELREAQRVGVHRDNRG
jgi:hypothetical protein